MSYLSFKRYKQLSKYKLIVTLLSFDIVT